MFKKIVLGSVIVLSALMTGCASVPMASKDMDVASKQFNPPSDGKAGLYVYRNSFVGQALKKNVFLDGKMIGESANKVYFYQEIDAGKHTLSTESEFGDNAVSFDANPGQNYFFEQYIKMGVFVGGANLKQVEEAEGKAAVRQCRLAKSLL
ncbi:DUF2846 domain-containing protein [Paraferrimonas sedimenticola]|uniref:DUF2846 domain-containing protein n=1 Tax=Paraferrimonas sedimenticola TaxID=375674 RepID=A0AA37RTT0_9GAMM|nr:DUF2846 domain-containing protein [Paraferrimonas sedimenticola]GLP95151.1 hypothetical protein GCM10007895_04570 [Paraferrimonas sedimenticola]